MMKSAEIKIGKEWFICGVAGIVALHVVPMLYKASPKRRFLCASKKMLCAAQDAVDAWKRKTAASIQRIVR